MNKTEFLEKLEAGLAAASPEERVAAVQYYTEYFDEAGPEREAEVLAELGEPGRLADEIIAASGGPAPGAAPPPPQPEGAQPPPPPPPVRGGYTPVYYNPHLTQAARVPSGTPSALKVLLAVLLAIILLPLLGGLFGGLAGIIVTAIVLFFIPFILGAAFAASGIASIIAGAFITAASTASGILLIGIGIVLVGLALLCFYGGGLLVGKVLPKALGAIFSGISKGWNAFSNWFKKL